MDWLENPCIPPEVTADMIGDEYKKEVARALRLSKILEILGDDYDLDRLRKLVEEDRAGRCKTLEKMVLEYQETIVPGYRKLAEKAMEERDAAVSDLETIMLQGGPDTCAYCRNDRCYGRGGRDCCNPIWRGRDNTSVTEKPCLIQYTGEP